MTDASEKVEEDVTTVLESDGPVEYPCVRFWESVGWCVHFDRINAARFGFGKSDADRAHHVAAALRFMPKAREALAAIVDVDGEGMAPEDVMPVHRQDIALARQALAEVAEVKGEG